MDGPYIFEKALPSSLPRSPLLDAKTPDGYLPPPSTTTPSRRSKSWRPDKTCWLYATALILIAYISHCRYRWRHEGDGVHVRPRPSGTNNPAYLIEATHGAVASENGVCSQIGVDALRDGGNAVDAAVATTFCVGVLNMFSSGIGGGGFMTVRVPPSTDSSNSSSQVYTVDFRETAPALSNTTMFAHDPLSSMFGGLAAGVPGEVRGLGEAHRRWGKLPWERLVWKSVELAQGTKVGKELARRIYMSSFRDLMLNNPDWSSIFAPNGTLLETGDMIYRTNYSNTLRTIALEGPSSFYTGPIAEALVNKIRSTGGIMSLEDLAKYEVKVEAALEGSYFGKKVYTSNAPTSGGVLIMMLRVAELLGGWKQVDKGLGAHRTIEIMKFGFAARTKLCDPAFNDDPERIAEISTQAYADDVFKNITDDTTHPPEYYRPVYDVPIDHGTSHTSVVDKDGMAVAITSTVNLVFGSQVLDPVTGVILNDEMDDFSKPGIPNYFGLWPSPYNYPEPHKKPLSSTAPTVVENADGSLYLVIGGSGGSRIFPSLFQTILNLIERGMDLSRAIEAGRVHDQLYPLAVDVDNTAGDEVIDGLKVRGHNVTVEDINRVAAVVQGVMLKDGKIFAASDSRKNGIAAGY